MLKAQRLNEEVLQRRGRQPSLRWLAAQLSTAKRVIQPEHLGALLRSWHDTQTYAIGALAS